MRFLLLFYLFFIPYLSFGQNYFKDGVRWIMLESFLDNGVPKNGFSSTYLCKAPNDSLLSLYSYHDEPESKPVFIAYIKTEGEKVFFNQYEDSSPRWYLMYDFGLKPGEGCYIYRPLNYNLKRPRRPVREYMVCKDILRDEENPEWEIMDMVVYEDENDREISDKGCWIKGLSSENDVSMSNAFHLDGGRSELIAVFDNGELIYSKITGSDPSKTVKNYF